MQKGSQDGKINDNYCEAKVVHSKALNSLHCVWARNIQTKQFSRDIRNIFQGIFTEN